MFYKFGDKTRSKTVVKSGSNKKDKKDINEEIFDENDDTNRRSAILKRYKQEEAVLSDSDSKEKENN
jgi:hypothetical protein